VKVREREWWWQWECANFAEYIFFLIFDWVSFLPPSWHFLPLFYCDRKARVLESYARFAHTDTRGFACASRISAAAGGLRGSLALARGGGGRKNINKSVSLSDSTSDHFTHAPPKTTVNSASYCLSRRAGVHCASGCTVLLGKPCY
jgi:hypothetical protein